MSEKQQLNVYLPADLVRRIKIAAIEADLSYSTYVERTLQEHLDEVDRARREKPS